MSLDKVNLGVIGLDQHADQSCLKYFIEAEDCKIVRVSTPDMSTVYRYRASETITTRYAGDVFNDPDIDMIYLVKPFGNSSSYVLDAIEHSQHVVIEKPMSSHWPPDHKQRWDKYRLLDNALFIAGENELMATTCQLNRFSRPYVNTKQILEDHSHLATIFDLPPHTDLGEVSHLNIDISYATGSHNTHTASILDHLPTELDTSLYLLGFSGLQRAICRQNNNNGFAVGAMRDDGKQLRLYGRNVGPGHEPQENLAIQFSSGAKLNIKALTGIIDLSYEDQVLSRQPLDYNGQPLFKNNVTEQIAQLGRHLLDRVKDPTIPPYLSNREILMTMAATLALDQSSQIIQVGANCQVTYPES